MLTTLFTLFFLVRIAPVSQEPNKQPQLAASGDVTAIVYGSGRTIYSAWSTDGGATFSKPGVVAELPVLPLGRHRGPRIALSGSTMLVSAIGAFVKGDVKPGSEGELFVWRSADRGKTWSEAIRVNDAPRSAREGLHAFAADEQGNAAAVWLDLRDSGTRLYGAYSKDAGRTWSKNTLVYQSPDGTICQCCHPSLQALGNGEFAVLFRNALGGARDMYLARIRDGRVTAAAEKQGSGRWQLNACPMDGGGVALVNGKPASAWRRADDLFLALPGVDEMKIGTGKDIAFSAQGNSIYATWSSGGKIESWSNGKTETLSAAGSFANVVALPKGGAIAAWEENGAIAVRRLE
ncbi:MAG: exo-alpha-sialidase [Acidobacteria bacterium]|nr:exo-alpha-sialidase [Acidobacteriota bacterium]